MNPIGILGGSFDPVHHGHLRLAIEVMEALSFDHVRLVPLCRPNAEKSPAASMEMRLAMLQAAVVSQPRLVVDDRELRRGGVSYTVDTLQSLRDEFADRSICLLLGMDAFRSIGKWHQWQRILSLSHIVVAERPGAREIDSSRVPSELTNARTENPETLLQHAAGSIYQQTVCMLDISSTRIREGLRAGRSVHYLLPDPVLEIIQRHALYQRQE